MSLLYRKNHKKQQKTAEAKKDLNEILTSWPDAPLLV